jgi:hypothetical protein
MTQPTPINLRPAAEVRSEVDNEERDHMQALHDEKLRFVVEQIERHKRQGTIVVDSVPLTVLDLLRKQGYSVERKWPVSLFDADRYVISW